MFGPDFYPTPRSVAYSMLAKISKEATNFLSPSAGRGDLAQAICDWHKHERYSMSRKVDCIEADPNLCGILRDKGFTIVGYDWLTYPGVSYYDAIVMNPPFSNGDEHLLRAWDFLHDGEIVCLLNEETVTNPYTEMRQRLAKVINEHGSTENLGPVFKGADRKTLVNVVLVYLRKVSDDDRADLWTERPTEERPANADIGASAEECMVAIRDTLGNMQHYYDMANTHMVKAFEHLRKAAVYLGANGIEYLSDYGKANKDARNLVATLGKGWKAKVWENLGWHFQAAHASGVLSVSPCGKEWMASMDRWHGSGKTPMAALADTMRLAGKELTEMKKFIALIEGVATLCAS